MRLLTAQNSDIIWPVMRFQFTVFSGHSAMSSGLLANRLIGLFLAVTMLCPSWMGGNCCCSRKLLTKPAGACCQTKSSESAAHTKTVKKPCCAARAVAAKSVVATESECRPISPCRCRTQVDSVAVSGAVRPVELTTHHYLAVPTRAVDCLSSNQQAMLLRSCSHKLGDPPDAAERCAQLSRWLA